MSAAPPSLFEPPPLRALLLSGRLAPHLRERCAAALATWSEVSEVELRVTENADEDALREIEACFGNFPRELVLLGTPTSQYPLHETARLTWLLLLVGGLAVLEGTSEGLLLAQREQTRRFLEEYQPRERFVVQPTDFRALKGGSSLELQRPLPPLTEPSVVVDPWFLLPWLSDYYACRGFSKLTRVRHG